MEAEVIVSKSVAFMIHCLQLYGQRSRDISTALTLSSQLLLFGHPILTCHLKEKHR